MRLRLSLRKTIKNSETELAPEKAFWLDVRTIARVEAELLAFSLLHEPYHGVHHQRAGLPHAELPQHVGALVPTTPEQCPYPSYRHALLDLLRSLTDPLVGAQRRTTMPSRT
jgi:fatty acid desaturase